MHFVDPYRALSIAMPKMHYVFTIDCTHKNNGLSRSNSLCLTKAYGFAPHGSVRLISLPSSEIPDGAFGGEKNDLRSWLWGLPEPFRLVQVQLAPKWLGQAGPGSDRQISAASASLGHRRAPDPPGPDLLSKSSA